MKYINYTTGQCINNIKEEKELYFRILDTIENYILEKQSLLGKEKK